METIARFLLTNSAAILAIAGPAIGALVAIAAHLLAVHKAQLEIAKLNVDLANLRAQSMAQTAKLELEVEQ